MMRDQQSYRDDCHKHASARSREGETWCSRGDRSSDLWRKRYTFERSPSDKSLSCTRVGAARDHIDTSAKGVLRQRQAKTDNFTIFRHCIFAFHAGLRMTLKIRQFLVAEVAPCRKRG